MPLDATSIPLGVMNKTGWRLSECAADRSKATNPENRNWRLHYHGLTDIKDMSTWIRARGIFPCDPRDWRDATFLWHGRRWWLSIVVAVDTDRDHGSRAPKIDFNNDHGDFVYVNDRPEYPGGLMESAIIDREIDRLKNERDKKYPRGNRLC